LEIATNPAAPRPAATMPGSTVKIIPVGIVPDLALVNVTVVSCAIPPVGLVAVRPDVATVSPVEPIVVA
jgi:hypothetical protein